MKTVYLHIGTPKTGTTYIQAYLAHNRARLLDDGVCYLTDKEGVTAHGVALSLGCWEAHPPDVHHENLQSFQEQLRTALTSPAERIVISSEMFCEVLAYRRLSMIKRLHATLTACGPARIVVVCYLRRQDLFIESRQAHDIVHCGAGYPVAKIDPELVCSYGDYYKLLSDYREVFGSDIVVRPYERRQLINGDVLDDFLNVIDVERKPDEVLPSAQETNPRLRGDLVELLRLYNESTLSERPDPLAKPWPSLVGLFTLEQLRSEAGARFRTLPKTKRLAILKRYAASNRKVAIKFLGRKDGKLFRDPVVTECADSKKGRTLQLEEVTPLFAHMMTGVLAHSEWLASRLTAVESAGKKMWAHATTLEQRLQAAQARIGEHERTLRARIEENEQAALTRLREVHARMERNDARTRDLESALRNADERYARLEREHRQFEWRLACRSIDGKKVIGWGTGSAFRADYVKNPVGLAYAVDNDPKKWGRRVKGTIIAPPARLEAEDPSNVVIVVYSAFFDDIATQITSYGPFTVIPSTVFANYATPVSEPRKPSKARRRYSSTGALALATAVNS